jgi:beta-glucosidase
MTDQINGKFYWGASTASHQVEGGNYNQWTEWEKLNSVKLASSAKSRLGLLKNWDDIKAEATDPANYISGDGIDHYNRFEEDFDLAKNLNLNSLRFSIEWSRIEPKEGEWDQNEIIHYKKYIAEMKRRGLEPFLNIWHWTEPIWFTEKGSFTKRKNLKYFDRFTKKIAEELLNDIDFIFILNEPTVYASMSYLSGEWPPNSKSPIMTTIVICNLIKAHKIAYANLKLKKPTLQIGVAAHITNFKAVNKNSISRLVAKLSNYFWNFWFLNRISSNLDFIGINYYFTNCINKFRFNDNPKEPLSDMGWYMDPSSIKTVIRSIYKKYNKPIIISENGLADNKDKYREWWLKGTVGSLEEAREEGIEIFGYLHWSLLDNFEWAYGWWPKFGLISVDRNNMSRTVRKSAKYYSRIIENHSNNFIR